MLKNQNQSDLDLVLSLLPKVREIALHYYKSDNLEIELKEESGNSPVTLADKEIDLFLHNELMKMTPDYGWLSEEIEDDGSRLNKSRVWIVDPIDGTKGFVHGTDGFACSIGLVEDGVPVLGIVYHPVSGDTIYGGEGVGLFRNGEVVTPSFVSDATKALYLTSVGETKKGLWAPYSQYKQEVVGSIAYKMALLSVGHGDVVVSLRGKNIWDIAAGHALCREAGLKLTDFQCKEIDYMSSTRVDRVILTTSDLHSDVCKVFITE